MLVRTLLATVVLASALAAALPAPAAENASWLAFRTQSRAIACMYVAPELRCDVLARGLRPRPDVRCRLDWVGLSLRRGDRARPVCAGDTVNNGRAPILRWGMTWRRHDLVCRARPSGLRCTNREGRGFTLSTIAWRTF